MKIAVHLGVKDEVELIGPCVDNLRRIGVDHFRVCDMYSTDGTAEFLAKHESSDFRLLKISNADGGEVWIRANTEFLMDCDADWLMFLDADEFPLPATGKLRDVLAGSPADIIEVPRYNVELGPNGPTWPAELVPSRYCDVGLIVSPIPDIRRHLSENRHVPWLRTVPLPKVIVRPKLIKELISGGHDIIPKPGLCPLRCQSSGLLIAHLALSTLCRFERKIKNVREFFHYQDAFAGRDLAWHWRRWVEMSDGDEIAREFENSIISVETGKIMRQQGLIKSAAEMLHSAGSV